MWSREEAESKIFDALKFIDIVIVEYLKIFFGILMRPKKTFASLHRAEIVTPFILFLLNLLGAGFLASFGNLFEFASKVINLIANSDKPTLDAAVVPMLGLLSEADALLLWWWSYITYVGLKTQIGGNLNFRRSIIVTLIIFIVATAVTSNIDNIKNISTIVYLNKYKSVALEALWNSGDIIPI